MEDVKRDAGISVLGALPWGSHLCLFYSTKQDLVDTLVPYFKAGLENNELCIWITSKPFSEEEVKGSIEKAIPDFSRYLASQQIEIIPHTEWYLKGGTYNRKRVLNAWIDKLERAMASGYDGMRTTGDTAWVERGDWNKLIGYEEQVNNAIGNYRILSICTYPLRKYGASQVVDVINNHQYAFLVHKGELALIGNSERKQLEEALQASEEFSSNLLTYSPNPIIVINPDTSIRYVNPALETLTGFFAEEIVGRKAPYPWWTPETLQSKHRDLRKAMLEGVVRLEELFQKKNGERFWVEISSTPVKHEGELKYYQASWIDITEQKQAEEISEVIAKTALDGFWVANSEGRFLEINDSYCQMIGYTQEELLKMSIQDVEAAENPEDVARRIQKIKEQGYDHFESRHKPKDGRIIDVEINVNYLDVEQGQMFVFIRDITEQKQAEIGRMIPLRPTAGRRMIELQKRFIKEGFEGLEEQEIIELLLSLVLPARKAKQLAIACLERFKNLRDFLAASPKELQQIGITPASMFCIKLLHELPIKLLKQKIVTRSIYKSSSDVFNYLYYSMRDLKNEVFKVIYLNNRSQIIDTVDLFEGMRDIIPIRPREIVESAIEHNAAGLIFVHNHPTGDPTPSKSDKQLTRDLTFVGNILQINVLDHIIIGADSYFSFADDGLIQKYNDNFLNLKIKGVLASGVPYHHYINSSIGLHHQRRVNSSLRVH